MKLKTYTAPTMAQALAQVRKDLGTDAMILHTRSFRTGSWLGLGGKPMVEITASSPQPTKSRKSRRVKREVHQSPAQVEAQREEFAEAAVPEIVVQRSRVPQRQAVEAESRSTNAPVDDRAMLLQGLMGDTASPIRDRRNESESRRASIELEIDEETPQEIEEYIDEQVEDVQSSPVVSETEEAEFTPMTFERVDAVEQTLQEEVVEDEPVIAQAFKPEPLIAENPETVESVFETAIKNPPLAEDPKPTPKSENDELRAQIETLQKMMGQVLDTTRRTAVAVNKTNPDASLPPVEMSQPLHAMYTKMIDNDVSVEHADRFIGTVRDRLDADELNDADVVRHALLREIESSITTTSQSLLTTKSDRAITDRPHVLALIGPTGVGKTTTVAKLAATAKLKHGKKVALITSDTYRIAAVEQLKTYASIIGLEIKIANTPDEMHSVISTLNDVDLIVIDTAGRSQNNHARLDELGNLIASAQPDETHLVLSSTVGENVLRKTAERFIDLGPDRCILTKIDEAVTTGMIAGISERIRGLPLSFVTVGQEVPDDILPARADRLARAVLDGPDAVVPSL